jgi:hypothetical protein
MNGDGGPDLRFLHIFGYSLECFDSQTLFDSFKKTKRNREE